MNIKKNPKKLNLRKIFLLFFSIIIFSTSIYLVGFEKIYLNLIQFKIYTPILLFIIFIVNLFFVSFRLKTLLSYSGIRIPFIYAHQANVNGQFASIIFISFFGQTFGRQIILRKFKVPSVFISSLTIFEKLIIFFISGLFCLFGSLKLGVSTKFISILGNSYSIQIALAILLAVAINIIFNSSKIEKEIFKLFNFKNFYRFLNLSTITLVSQFLVIVSFALAAKNFNPSIPIYELIAASAVTSFAAALPISVNGWGIREIVAVFTFGIIGMEPSQSIAISILVGITSTLAIIFSYLLSLIKQKKFEEISKLKIDFKIKNNLEILPTLFISSLSIIFIFFQFRIPTSGESIMINISDPFAICALVVTVTNIIFYKRLISWKIYGFNTFLLSLTVIIFISFIRGVNEIGVTPWALTNRLIGWFILLGYLSVGPIINLYIGKEGLRKAINILVITSTVVVIFTMITRFMHINNLIDLVKLTLNFEGFSGNRNAFAFQLICCLEASLVLSAINKNKLISSLKIFNLKREDLFAILNGFLISGICLSGSQAGIYTTIIVLILFSFLRFFNSKLVLKSISLSILFIIIFNIAIGNINLNYNDTKSKLDWVGSDLIGFTDASNTERLNTILVALKMWKESIFLGIGLGVFRERSSEYFGKYIVIHSTPIWILVEFGMLGFILLFSETGYVVYKLYKNISNDYRNKILIMNILSFCLFGTFHEIFYQRIFWLLLGLCFSQYISKETDHYINEDSLKSLNPINQDKNELTY